MIPAGPIGLREGEIETIEVSLNLVKIDNSWKKDVFSYSGKGGMDRKENKIAGVKGWLRENSEVHSPIIYITNDNPNNLSFVDGRHTTAVLFESGYSEATFIIPAIQKETILRAFGHHA